MKTSNLLIDRKGTERDEIVGVYVGCSQLRCAVYDLHGAGHRDIEGGDAP